MSLDGVEISNLIISESEALFEVFDHLFNLPTLGVIFDDIDGRQMNIRTNQINGFFAFFFHNHDGYFSEVLDLPNKLGKVECFSFPIHEKGNFPIGRSECQQGCDLRFFPMHPENRIGFELRDHMVATLSTDMNQSFRPVPTIGQEVEFTRDGKPKSFDNLFGQSNFSLKITTSFSPLGMIESGPQG